MNINNTLHNLGKRIFSNSKIDEMKKNIDKLSEDTGDIQQVFEKTNVLEKSMFVQDLLYTNNPHVYDDVEFFTTLSNKTTPVFDVIHNCSTVGGKLCAKNIYANPLCDLRTLQQRRVCLEWMEKQYVINKAKIDSLLSVLKDNEKHVTWLLEEKEENIKDLYSMVFFRLKGLKPLNGVGPALTSYNLYRIILSPLFGIVAPVFYFVIPYLIVMYKFKVYIPFTTYMKTMFYAVFHSSDTLFGNNRFFKYLRIASYLFSAAFYFQGIFTSIDVAKTVKKMTQLIITNFNSVIDYIDAANELQKTLWVDTHVSAYTHLSQVCHFAEEDEAQYVATMLKAKRNFGLFENFGEQLKIYNQHNVNVMKQMVRKTTVLDALLGAIKLKLDRNYAFTSTKHSSHKSPEIIMDKMVHPCIAQEKAVANNIMLGVDGKGRNAIITSPNSSGKSIIIKSIIINVLMSQTMGICCSESASITPFRFINTQINIPDSTGTESLFEAEMYRCKYTLDMVRKMQNQPTNMYSNNYTLTIMDEIFNSTNPVEAVAGAFAVCKKLTTYNANMLIFTTHFNYLTRLAKDSQCQFVNYKMETLVDENTTEVHFTYKLQPGVNKHMLALELLKRSCFSDDIIDEAITIKNTLLKGNKS